MGETESGNMTLRAITFYYGIKKKRLAVSLDYTLDDLNRGATLLGWFTGPKVEYADLLAPSEIGRVSAIGDWNRSYFLVNLGSDGHFSLEPSAQFRRARGKAAAGLRS